MFAYFVHALSVFYMPMSLCVFPSPKQVVFLKTFKVSRHRLHVDIAIHTYKLLCIVILLNFNIIMCMCVEIWRMDINFHYIGETVLPGKITVLHIDRKLFIIIACIYNSKS